MALSPSGLLLASLLVSCFICASHGFVLFSSLQRTIEVTASPKPGQVLKAGVDKIHVSWSLNQSVAAGTDSAYKTIKVKLCYAPISQKDRAWRKTVDNLHKDKTCQFKIVARPYDSANKTVQTYDWLVERDIPGATYFVRAYAYDAEEHEVGFGQTTNVNKTTNLFEVEAITGRHASMDIASICFSAFSVVALFFFFFIEKRKAKSAPQK